jgi:hypothetical protein
MPRKRYKPEEVVGHWTKMGRSIAPFRGSDL